jgi:hypothetical protein
MQCNDSEKYVLIYDICPEGIYSNMCTAVYDICRKRPAGMEDESGRVAREGGVEG